MGCPKPEDAGVLLQSTQQLRTHWSNVITAHLTVAVSVNVAIWSYFLKSYVDQTISNEGEAHLYLFVASTLSSLLLGFWRMDARSIDSQIARLYPDFILYEGVLSAPPERSTSGYLSREVHQTGTILSDPTMSPEDKAKAIALLVKNGRIGNRGHFSIDVIALSAIALMTFVSVVSMATAASFSQLECLLLTFNALGAVMIVVAMFRQWNPRENDIDRVKGELGFIEESKET